MPLLSYNQHKHFDNQTSKSETEVTEKKSSTGLGAESGAKALLRDDFLINMQKFASNITRTLQQIEGEVRLDVPEIVLSDNIEEVLSNPELMAIIREKCAEWENQIGTALNQQLEKTRQGSGPIAEIDFWRERNAALSALTEQLKIPLVAQMFNIYSQVETDIESRRPDLNKYYVEAKDNVRFLSTLERHFKNIAHGATFQVVIETVPSMMNALRMVWIISRHYNKDELMVPLMERIAWELAERVARVIDVHTLYK